MRDDELLDIRQAADFLKVSETSLRRWTNAGRLPCLRVGRRRERRFRRAELLAFAEQQPGVGPGVAASRSAAAGAHLLGLHGSDGGGTDLAAACLADAFREGRTSFLVASSRLRDAVLQRLQERHPIAKSRIERGELTGFEFVGSVAGQLEDLEGRFERARRRGAESFCLVGEAWRVKKALRMDSLVEYEAGYDTRIAHRYPVMTLCLYDVRAFSASELLGALKLHPDTLRHPSDRLLA